MLPEGRTQPWRQWFVILTLVSSDILLALLFWVVALVLQSTYGRGALSEISVALIAPYTAVWIGMRALVGLYPGYGLNAAEELRRQTYAALGALAITATFAVGFQVGHSLSRLLVGLNFLELLLLAPVVRHFVKSSLAKIGLWGKPVVVLGVGETAKQLVRTLRAEWGLGFKPVAAFDFRMAPAGGVLEGIPYGGTVTDALALAQKRRIDTVIFAMPSLDREHLARFVERASLSFRHVIIIPNLNGVTSSAVTARDFVGIFGVELKHNLLVPWNLRLKRMLDLIVTMVGGTLILPFLLVIFLLVWMDSRGHVFYRAQRMGQDGKLFTCVKFRTMVPEAEETLQQMLRENAELREEYSKYHKLRVDPRVTHIGRILRKYSLDELPQLYNVLRGEMSLVGPRPYLPRESEKVGAAQNEILRVPPGVTGPWQVAGRNHTSFKERIEIDAYYVRNWSIWLDFIILARTMSGLKPGRGAY